MPPTCWRTRPATSASSCSTRACQGPCARELYDRVRALDPSVPVLICSAHSLNEPALKFVRDEHLPFPKPFTRNQLLETLHNMLSQTQATHCGITRK